MKNISFPFEAGEAQYQKGLLMMQRGLLKEAINAFQKTSFFVPEKPHPFVASAECYVSLCDFQGAVKQYRRALWLLRSRDERGKADFMRISSMKFDIMPKHFPGPDNMSLTVRNSCNDEGINNDLSEDSDFEQCFSSGQSTVVGVSESPSVINSYSAAHSWGQCGGDGRGGASFNERSIVTDQAFASAVETRLAGILDALSIVLYNTGDYAQALRFAEESLELRQHPQVNLHRCAYLVALEREDEAEKALEKHLKDHACHHIEATSMLVHLYSFRQAFRHAKELLENVPKHQRQHPQILLSQHIFDYAYSVFRTRSIAKSDVQGLTRCLAVFPEDSTLLFERAKYYIDKGMEKKAIPDLFYCLKNSDGSHRSALELMTKTLFNFGASLDGQNGIRDAIEYYTTSLLWNSENIPVLLARGDCYAKLEDYQKALQDFFHVDNISPRNVEAKRRIAFLHDVWGTKFYTQGKLEEAEREFSNAIATCDAEPLFYYHRARCRFEMNEPRYALRDVLSCKRLNPQSVTIRDFVNAHLSCLALEAKESPVEVKLPMVQSAVSRRTGVFCGGGEARTARRVRNRQQEFELLKKNEGSLSMGLPTRNVSGCFDGVLKSSKANLHHHSFKRVKVGGHETK